MEFMVGAFDDLLSEMGQRVNWRRSELCPCRDPDSGAALQGCKICHGLGSFWEAGVPAWAGMSGMRTNRAWQDSGLYETGDVVNTIGSDSPLYNAGENDRVQMLDSTEPFRAVFTHDGTDRVQYFIREIDFVFYVDQPTGQVVQCAVPVINPDGSFTWADPTTAPPVGVQYSMRGRRRPEFFLFKDFPQDRAHFDGMELPRRVVLRRFDLFGRGLTPGQ